MNIETTRKLYKIGIIVAAILFVAMLIDHFANEAALLVPLAVIFAIVALWLLVMLFLKPTEDTVEDTVDEPASEPTALLDYPGDVHEVVDLEGVGPAYAERLHGAGIFHTQELLFADDDHIQQAVKVPAKTVRAWKSMSQLVKVRGIGPQYAEALTRGGIDSIEGLRDGDVGDMTRMVNAYLDGLESTVVGQRISEKRMTTWQKAARKMEKVPIDMDAIKVRNLESKAARADAAADAA